MPDLTNLFNLLEEDGAATGLSKATGISSGNICDWKSGRSKPNAETLVKVADYFSCSADYLLGRTNIKELQKQSESIIHLIDMGEIIYIDTHLQPVSAGKGNIYIDENPVQQLYPSTSTSLKAAYCVRISGESMYPNYLDGDIVYVDNKTKDLVSGDIGIFIYAGEAYCKEYHEENGVIKLVSLNPDQELYNPIVIENDSFEIQGKVIGKFHAD